jgi:hypothetical protein
MRHPSGRWARCRRSAPILRDPRSSAGVAAPREARRRTSIATREPRGSRASRSTSSRPSRRLRERITQPLEARERAARSSASRPTIERCAGLLVTTACSHPLRTSEIRCGVSCAAVGRCARRPGHRCGDDAASRRAHQALQGVRGLDSPHLIPSRIRDSAVQVRP